MLGEGIFCVCSESKTGRVSLVILKVRCGLLDPERGTFTQKDHDIQEKREDSQLPIEMWSALHCEAERMSSRNVIGFGLTVINVC